LANLEQIGISTKDWKLEIHNLVIGDKVDLPCTIERLVASMDPKQSSFESEQLPALIYKDWGVSFLVSTGNVILTGSKSLEQVSVRSRSSGSCYKTCREVWGGPPVNLPAIFRWGLEEVRQCYAMWWWGRRMGGGVVKGIAKAEGRRDRSEGKR